MIDNEIDSEGEMSDIQEYKQIDLHKSRQGVGESDSKEHLSVIIEDVVDVGHWLRYIVVLQQILVHIYSIFLCPVKVYKYAQ